VMGDPARHGFRAALAKPYTLAELGAVVGAILARR